MIPKKTAYGPPFPRSLSAVASTASTAQQRRAFTEEMMHYPEFSRFHYASYPREAGTGIEQLDHELTKAFEFIASGRPASIRDLLYDFRICANYTGVSSILKLTDGGCLGFLMKNLGILVFFAGGIAELAVMRAIGEKRFLVLVRRFQRDFIARNERFARNMFLIPAYVRLRSYQHLGIITHNVRFVVPELDDPVQFLETDAT